MANVLTVKDVQPSDRAKVVVAGCVLSGSYVQFNAGTNAGEQLKLDSAGNPGNLPYPGFGARGFDRAYAVEGPAGYTCEVVQSNNGSWFLKIFSAVGTELAAGAYPAAITGDANFLLGFEGKNL